MCSPPYVARRIRFRGFLQTMMHYKADSGAIITSHKWIDPALVCACLANSPQDYDTILWLDSSNALASDTQKDTYNRYSFIAVNPYKTYTAPAQLDDIEKECATFTHIWQDLPDDIRDATPPFRGGIAGLMGYDLFAPKQTARSSTRSSSTPNFLMGAYASVLAFDWQTKTCFITATGANAETDIETYTALLKKAETQQLKPVKPIAHNPHPLTSNFTRNDYCQAVQHIIGHILAGDIFQANLAQCFTGTLHKDDTAWDYYCRLRHISPAPFAAFLKMGDWAIASASPERFVHIDQDRIESHPIKGTRKRGEDAASDAALKQALLASDKDRAENIMIVDLLRNDLSKSCRDHSIYVPRLCEPQSFANVHHLVSVVCGQKRDDITPFAALTAALPGGSITGAPKKRAMEVISAYEPTPRGGSYGICGYIGFDGTIDSSIMIRTAFIKDKTIQFHVGGGIVADSDPESEYNESLDKARDLKAALGL